ncbi:MAG: ChrR family anti-sigma-E factor [Marinobacterium sp.]
MKISHHLDDATLMSRAAGALSEGMTLLVDSHLHWCKTCQTRAWEAECIGGDMLARIEPQEMSEGSLDSILGMLDGSEEIVAERSVKAQGSQEVPEPLAQIVGSDLDAIDWKRLGPGVQHFDFNFPGEGACRLLRIQPGVSIPHHTHKGNELTMILRGSYSDDMGRFCQGDVADLDEEIKHQPIVDTGSECICLIATEAPLKFTGIMGRLAQPFIGL